MRLVPLFISIFLSFTWSIKAQFQFNFNDSLPVYKFGNLLKHPWAGGLNYAQFSDIDYDFDGDLDLFVFDRSNDQIRIFEHIIQGTQHSYHFDPLGSYSFPSDVRYRAVCLDYDFDGQMDLFTYGIGGVKAYKNIGNVGSGLQWQLSKNLIYSDYNGTSMGLYVSSADIPAIVDVDGDQDLDFLVFSIAGDHVEYHKNLSQELYGNADSLRFELKNRCWGGFIEEVTSNAITLFDVSTLCTNGNVPNPQLPPHSENEKAHSGSSLLALDLDQSNTMDLIIGDVSYGNLNLLINGGNIPNSNSPMISVDANFPSNSVPASIQIFPASYYVDIDFDGKKDLLVSPNAKGTSENEKSVWKYKNNGSSSLPIFNYQTNAFLQEDMVEHGIGSVPVFADVTNDGLPDMFVANYFTYKPVLQKESKIAYYKNTGTSTAPIFTFIDNDFLNLSTLNLGFRTIPTFGDLNNDGKPELILGLENGSLMYFENISSGSTPSFAPGIANYDGNGGSSIQIGQYAAPQLFDVNSDNLLDLVIGEKTGKIIYYENIGSSASPIFSWVSNFLGGIDVSTATPDGFPYPHFFKYQDTTYLIVGAYDGKLRMYDSIDGNISGTFALRSFPFLGLEVGAFSAASIMDLDNDNNLDLYVGQDLGGVFRLEHKFGSNLHVESIDPIHFEVYPNPTLGKVFIESNNIIGKYQITDVYGKCVSTGEILDFSLELDFSAFEKGTYFFYSLSNSISRKICKL